MVAIQQIFFIILTSFEVFKYIFFGIFKYFLENLKLELKEQKEQEFRRGGSLA